MQLSPLAWPSTAQSIQSSAEAVTSQVGAAMDSAVGLLTAIEADAGYAVHPLSGDAEALLGLRSELKALLVQGQVITASPYHFEVGDKLQAGHFLTPTAARDVLAAKLTDKADVHRPTGSLHCIVLLVTASNKAQFASALNTLTQVLTLPDWLKVARQAAAMVTNEQDKFYVPAAIVQPRFKPCAQLNANPLRGYARAQAAQIATLESLASDATTVVGKLSALAEKRAAQLEKLSADITALQSLAGSVWALKLTGSHESLASQLANTAMPSDEPHCVMSLMLSSSAMTFFEELFGC